MARKPSAPSRPLSPELRNLVVYCDGTSNKIGKRLS